ncbi:MAG TPA: ACT domain-containing protein [Micromonosporaceae bacterium]
MRPVHDLDQLLAQLRPALTPGQFVFTTVTGPVPAAVRPVMTFTEGEGLSLIAAKAQADAAGLRYVVVTSWITLTVHSALDAVGLTATVSKVLADAGIACNVVAATYHDHIFVPEADAEAAMRLLTALSAAANA